MNSDARTNTPPATASGDMTAKTGLDLKYRSRIFATFPDPVMVLNRQGRVVFMNPAAEDSSVFRYRPQSPLSPAVSAN